MQVFIGADHGGFELKEELKEFALNSAHFSSMFELEDLGAFAHDPADDYPKFGFAVAQKISQDVSQDLTQDMITPDQEPQVWGVLICRSGGGMAIAANRFPGVRAVVCRSLQDVQHARSHNNANILVLEGDHIGPEEAWQCLQSFLTTPFDGGRHTARVIALG